MYTHNFRTPSELNGKTIETCEMIPAEFGRTANHYLLLTFEDNTRRLLAVVNFTFYKPDPEAEHMEKTQFFSPADVAEKEQRDGEQAANNKRYQREANMRAYLALKASLGIED